MSSFIAFLQTVRADFTADEQIIIGCPSQEQVRRFERLRIGMRVKPTAFKNVGRL